MRAEQQANGFTKSSEGLSVKQENQVQEIGVSLLAIAEKQNEEVHLLLEVTFHTFRLSLF